MSLQRFQKSYVKYTPPPPFPAPKKKEIITNKPLQHSKVTASSETYWTKGIENFNSHSLKWRGSAFLDYAFFYRLLQSSIILSSLILSDPRIIKNNTCVIRFYQLFSSFRSARAVLCCWVRHCPGIHINLTL